MIQPTFYVNSTTVQWLLFDITYIVRTTFE